MNRLFDLIVKASKGRFVTITFRKKDGTLRTINGRIGVNYKGERADARMDSLTDQYVLIYGMREKGFRRVNLDTIESVASEGTIVYSASNPN